MSVCSLVLAGWITTQLVCHVIAGWITTRLGCHIWTAYHLLGCHVTWMYNHTAMSSNTDRLPIQPDYQCHVPEYITIQLHVGY